VTSLRTAALDAPPIPTLVRWSFWLFAAALLATGLALVRATPHVFPWPLKPDSSLLYGCMFLGLAVNYGYVALRGIWADAQVSLLGFLVYDLVLIGPFGRHFARALPDHRTSLALYTIVLVYSAALAAYYLSIARAARLWAHA
jgi:hypothetical protein